MILDWLAQDFVDLFACDSRARITVWCNTKADFRKACFPLLGPCSGILKFGKQVVTAQVVYSALRSVSAVKPYNRRQLSHMILRLEAASTPGRARKVSRPCGKGPSAWG
jgi:hypothetical protein